MSTGKSLYVGPYIKVLFPLEMKDFKRVCPQCKNEYGLEAMYCSRCGIALKAMQREEIINYWSLFDANNIDFDTVEAFPVECMGRGAGLKGLVIIYPINGDVEPGKIGSGEYEIPTIFNYDELFAIEALLSKEKIKYGRKKGIVYI